MLYVTYTSRIRQTKRQTKPNVVCVRLCIEAKTKERRASMHSLTNELLALSFASLWYIYIRVLKTEVVFYRMRE